MASESVRIICPNLKCRAILAVPQSARGKTVRCRQCGTRVKIPDAPPVKPVEGETTAETTPAEKTTAPPPK